MAFSTLIIASLVVLRGGAVEGAHSHPPRSSPAKEEARDSSGGTFVVHQTRNTQFKGKSGLEAMVEVYEKYGVELTPDLKKAVEADSNLAASRRRQTVEAVPPQGLDYEYISPVQIGTPSQTLYLNFDTGSADLWVFSTDTNSSEVGGQTLYNPGSSSTAQLQPGYTYSIGYGDGSGSRGIVYRDRVAVAGFVANSQAVESAQTVSPEFTGDPYASGLLGLGMSSGNTVQPQKQLTFFDNIKPSLALPLFTADLKAGVPGTYGFGFIGNSYSGNIQYAPINRTSIYWLFAITGYRVGPATTPGNPNSGYITLPFRAIADTGTSLLMLQKQIVDDYWGKVPGSRYDPSWAAIVFPCGTALPDFTFGIGLYKGVVPGRYLNYGTTDGTTCYGGLQDQGSFAFGIVGITALKAQYVIFDSGNMRVGLANKPL